jgi:hypothetical protein
MYIQASTDLKEECGVLMSAVDVKSTFDRLYTTYKQIKEDELHTGGGDGDKEVNDEVVQIKLEWKPKVSERRKERFKRAGFYKLFDEV